ncbi:uncharacterized protein LOC126577113 [Anopheles aquasalis]|uniref:uncharacterized protein LOC126577113 n=1 Tax=Anopheles aquasalis TaxID=42839 RepID=UPI00215A794F|nr:uncharacterized protein LOC126577113 [Anopheles aquasalis]XP_050094484.1 uncharacterized protein LOC126577113 [Anopheles aquasalis]
MEEKPLFEAKHCLSLKCVLFLFYGGLGCIYPFLQTNMTQKGFAYTEIYSISAFIPLAALLGPFVFALLADKWATGNAFAYGKRLRILTAITIIASMVLYVLLMFAVSRTPPPEVCEPQASFLCNRKGAFIVQEKCSDSGVCHDWAADKSGSLKLENCTYSCQQDSQFDSTCYARQAKSAQLVAALQAQEDGQGDDGDGGTVLDLGSGHGSIERDTDGDGIPDNLDTDDDNDGIPDSNDPDSSNDLDGDGIPNELDPDDDNDGVPDSEDLDDDNDGIPDDQDVDDDNDGIPDSLEGKARTNDLDGDGIPNELDDDDDNDGIPDAEDTDDDNDGIPDEKDVDDDNDGIPDSLEGSARTNDLDGDGIPNEEDPDDDNDGIPDAEDDDDDNDGIPDSLEGKARTNDLDGDGIPNELDDDDDNDGIPDAEDTDDDNDGIPDEKDVDDDNDGIPDSLEGKAKLNDLDGDGIPNDQDLDDDNDGIPDAEDDDDDNDGIPDDKDNDDDNDGIPDSLEGKPVTHDLDGDGIPDDEDPDDDNDGIPDTEDDDDDNDGIPDAEDVDDDNDGIPDVHDKGQRSKNDLDGDGISNDEDPDDDNDGIPDDQDSDDDNDGIPDADDEDDDNDGIADNQETVIVPTAIVCADADEEDEVCHTYTQGSIALKATFDEHSERDEGDECSYPLDGFRCPLDKAWIKAQPVGCKAVVQCDIVDPYEDSDSILHGTTCDGDEDNDGDDDEGDTTFYYYLSIRSLLDFFLLGALTLLNTAIVIATRDPSTGVADFGRQLVWGAVGWIIFFNDDYEQAYMLFVILYTTAAVILLSPLKMDLSPVEEWWQFRTTPQKFLSVPAVRKYFQRCWLPFLVAIGLGSMWSVIDSIDESHMLGVPNGNDGDDTDGEVATGSKRSSDLFHTFVRTILLAGDLLAIPVLVYSRRIIEAFGTCKILVAAFLSLVVRFILLAILDYALWDVVEDLLLPTTLGLTWITLVLHFRDLLPRKVTALAQALPVIAHFGFGRFFGALIGIEQHYHRLENDYEILAGVLFAVTILSIVLYRYREIVLGWLGQYIPSLKPADANGAAAKAKGETNV